ncbi:hypothetical protein C2S53_002173 [Perilla frutescens var. hirtella]|uniref:Uncharacterized protein n=1 Tax=Perilla frutescens var. hirtella TaxID=608512 RepID=A0AAD4JLG2_PERFH|nr:hypothetical protein C2S53_002173 [Perilla frutescens var. hirtella]
MRLRLKVAAIFVMLAAAGCPDRCGNVSIPFPFGTAEGCYLDDDSYDSFIINCSRTPAGDTVPFWGLNSTAVFIFHYCYAQNGTIVSSNDPWIRLYNKWRVSNTANKFVVVGCDTTGSIYGQRLDDRFYKIGCTAMCGGEDDVEKGSCSGLGCCQTSIPKHVNKVDISLESNHNYTRRAMPARRGALSSKVVKIIEENITNLRNVEMLPMVINWFVGEGNCREAKANSSAYACKSVNSKCYEPDNGFGYRCNCAPGYQGNP